MMRSSSAIGEVYVRPEEQRREGDRADPDCRRQKDVCQHETPRKMRPPLQLSQPHLDEQQHENGCAELEEAFRTVAARRQVAKAEAEGQEEDPDDRRVGIDERCQPSKPVDLVRSPAAGVRPRGGRKRSAHDQYEGRADEREPEPLQLRWNERLDAAHGSRADFEDENGRAPEQRDRQEQMDHDDRPAKVGRDREQADRRLRQSPKEDRKREPPKESRQPRHPSHGEPHEQRHRDRHTADEPVAELDERVRVLGRQWMSRFAAGPMPAAETGVGEPHGGPGADDQPQRAELHEHERVDLCRSESKCPKPSERRGLGVHGSEFIQRGSRIAG